LKRAVVYGEEKWILLGEIEMMRGAGKGKGRGIARDDIGSQAQQRLTNGDVAAITLSLPDGSPYGVFDVTGLT
jgi:hypothetical protein